MIEKLIFVVFFWCYLIRTYFVHFHHKRYLKQVPKSILFLENFPIENAGYQYRAKKWADLLNKDSFNCEVLTILESKSDFDFDDFLFRGNHIHTPSVVFRAKNIENFILPNVVTGDYFLHLHNAYNGKIKRFEAKMAAYRVHLGGVFSLKQKNMSSKESFNFWRKQLNGYYHILKNYKLNLKQKRFINKAIYSLINILRIYAFQDNDISAAKQLALKQIKYTPKRGFNLKILIGAIASLIIPKYMAKRINTNKAKFS